LKIGIASGKGGTGKTTVATSLAGIAPGKVCYVDCDVEEPNGHIFLKPSLNETLPATVPVPRVEERLCEFCGTCRDVCRFNALAVLPSMVLVFDELCHGCGGCMIACPTQAIREMNRRIGVVEKGRCGEMDFIAGRLNVGEPMSPPLIQAVKREIPPDRLVFVDTPPGTSCPVIAALDGLDYCLLVTEPTPFGLNDLKLAVEMVRALGLPVGVVINRDGIGNRGVDEYCQAGNIPVLMRIPDDRRIAAAYSRGEPIIEALPEYRTTFLKLLENVLSEVQRMRMAI
jgi:MinD superfamily P-loop ATPase